jgi:hypothetical protein
MSSHPHQLDSHASGDSYKTAVLKYYFQAKTRSLLALLYFVFFAYFVLFYISNIFLSIRFVWGTMWASTLGLGAQDLVWGAIFLINLLAPFLLSLLALSIPYEFHKRHWPRSTRIALTLILGVLIFNLILFAEFSLVFVENQAPIKTFLEDRDIPLKK